MSATAAILIITSAFMHALWNFISKRRSPSLAFFFLMTASAALVMSPRLLLYRDVIPLIPRSVWGLLAVTGMAQLTYFFGLAGAYQRGDISLAYPLARAAPVLLVAAISLLLGRGEELGALSLVGMALIAAGCVILPLQAFQQVRLHDYFDIVTVMALVAALGTTAYTLFDDQALRQLRQTPAIHLSNREITLLFVSFQTLSSATMLGLGTLFLRSEWGQLSRIVKNRRLLISAMTTGVIVMMTYGLALAAMAYVTNVSYVVAFRQLSIPIGAILGFTLQQEPRYFPRVLGIGVVVTGLVLVGIG